jgi:hypothetical protein
MPHRFLILVFGVLVRIILVIVPAVTLVCRVIRLVGIFLGLFTTVDFLEDLAIFQRVVGLRMSWARPLQGFSIVFFIIAMPTKFLYGVDLAVVIASTLALEVVTAIAMLVSVVALIMIAIGAVPNVVVTSKVITAMVVTVVVASWRVWCFVGALVQQLLGIVGIRILLSGGEEVDHR